ncbi:M67 family metallopeptidase [Sphingomonas sp. CJ20]
MGMAVSISISVLIGIKAFSSAAQPREACGLLFGDAEKRAIFGFQTVENVAAIPETHFEIDPAALFAALRAERAGGPALAGYWHSHPSGLAFPSETDAAMAAPDGKLWLIVAGEDVTAWRAVENGSVLGRFLSVPIVPQ